MPASNFGRFPSRTIVAAILALLLMPAFVAERPPVARMEPVHDRYFGTTVVDPYRWMETPDSAELAAYLKAQNDCTRRVLAGVDAPRQKLLARILELQAGVDSLRFLQRAGDRYFFLETPAGARDARLATRAVSAGEKRVLLRPEQVAAKGVRAAIDFLVAAPDGRHVAVAVSRGGAEDWVLRVVETGTGRLLPDAVPRIADPFPTWAADGRGFYYARLQPLAAGAPATTTYDNVRVHYHALGDDPAQDAPVFGPGVVPDIELPVSSGFPKLHASRDGRHLVATHRLGVAPTLAVWVRDRRDPAARWRPIIDHADDVTELQAHAGRAYAISHKDAPNGRVLAFALAGETIADAEVRVPEGEVVISADNGYLAAASDALYLVGQRNGQSVVRRIAYDGTQSAQPVALPASGSIIEFAVDETAPGISFALQSPTQAPLVYRYDPARDSAADTGLRPPDPADFSSIVTRQVEVESSHGARVPLTITARHDLKLDGSHPVLLTAYGAYGAIVPMWFSAPDLAWYERGGVIAFVHARGGGEKGAAWHEAGRRTNKQHTIDDVLAAARWLIDQGYTASAHLAVAGKSAGGIAAGGAIVQRPELFQAALIRVGVTDLLRIEKSGGGPANIAEYGSVENEAEFRVLHAISPYANVRDGVAYPAVLLETGANDPRVPPWQLAKMTARLQAATASKRPILLRVDFDAGHGLGSDQRQKAQLLADEYAFLGWQLGLPGFAPGGGD